MEPIKSTKSCDSDNKLVVVEPKHLKTYRTIWKFFDFLTSLVGVSVYREVEISPVNLPNNFVHFLFCFSILWNVCGLAECFEISGSNFDIGNIVAGMSDFK